MLHVVDVVRDNCRRAEVDAAEQDGGHDEADRVKHEHHRGCGDQQQSGGDRRAKH